MKKPNGYDEARAFGDYATLPKGNYVIKIITAETRVTDGGREFLAIAFDIAEGEQKGFYDRDFKANTSSDRKWRGVYNIFLPTEDGSQKDGWTISALKRDMCAIDDSNSGFHFDWDESKLKGKIVGAKFRTEQYTKRDGSTGEAVRCCGFCSAASVRDGSATPAKDKLLNNNNAASTAQSAPAVNDELGGDDLPF